jgi:hypothetical protein
VETRRWINQSQPQTLYAAVFLLYINAVFTVLFGLHDAPYDAAWFHLTNSFSTTNSLLNLTKIVVVVGAVAAGYGISNERKWGYKLGLGVAALPLATLLYVCVAFQRSPFDFPLLNLMFNIAVFALLVHPQSREYERIWFK